MTVKDYGELTYDVPEGTPTIVSNLERYDHVVSCNKALSSKVEGIIKDGNGCLTLGGDHSIGKFNRVFNSFSYSSDLISLGLC